MLHHIILTSFINPLIRHQYITSLNLLCYVTLPESLLARSSIHFSTPFSEGTTKSAGSVILDPQSKPDEFYKKSLLSSLLLRPLVSNYQFCLYSGNWCF